MKKLLAILILACVCTYANSSVVDTGGDELLKKSINTYQQLMSYEDKGIYTANYFVSGVFHHQELKEFHTLYSSISDNFLFEWIDRNSNSLPKFNMMWKKGSVIKTLLWKSKLESSDDLNSSLSAISGISGGVAYWLPKYLLTGVFCPTIKKVKFLEKEEYKNNETLTKLELIYSNNRKETVWIETETFLVRKIEERVKLGKFDVVTTIEYTDVFINKDLVEDDFNVGIDEIKQLEELWNK